MKFFLWMCGLMLVATIVRFVGWVLYVAQWLSGGGDRLSFIDTLVLGASEGWAIASPVFAIGAKLIGMIALISLVVLSIPLLIAGLSRRSSPTVFISYHNSRETYALQLSEALASHGLKAQFLPFDPAATHDALLQRVDRALSAAQFVVCFPGDQPSFVEAEVLAAAAARKSIVFVVDYPEGRIPNTAAKTYPVLIAQNVLAAKFAPLLELLRYLYGGWRDTLRLYFLPNAPVNILKLFSDLASLVVVACLLPLFYVLWFAVVTVYALEYFFPQHYKVSMMVILFAGIFCLIGFVLTLLACEFLTNSVSGIIRRQRAATAARHAIRLGTCTATMLRAAFAPASDKPNVGFLDAIWPDQALAHHEAQRH